LAAIGISKWEGAIRPASRLFYDAHLHAFDPSSLRNSEEPHSSSPVSFLPLRLALSKTRDPIPILRFLKLLSPHSTFVLVEVAWRAAGRRRTRPTLPATDAIMRFSL